MYAVVDLETTGLFPEMHDRIVEVAVVHVDPNGRVKQDWCTIVNPDRDLGPQRIHGISASQAVASPSFGQVAGTLARLLAGRTLVAHNIGFEVRFLQAEFTRLGASVPLSRDLGLCTMRLAGRYLPHAGRSLADCCMVAGIRHVRAHSARGDAHATAALLGEFIRAEQDQPPWLHVCEAARRAGWPTLPITPVRMLNRDEPVPGADEQFVSRLVARLPRAGDAVTDEYLDLLDRCLLDRHISIAETRVLVGFAASLGIGAAQATELHCRYLAALAAAAIADGVVTEDERNDLAMVAGLLGLDPAHVDRALGDARAGDAGNPLSGFALHLGDQVVFTGELDEPRELWEARATALGLMPHSNVTKKTKLLIAADPDTMSRKAKKARLFGVPLVDPPSFLRLARAARQPG